MNYQSDNEIQELSLIEQESINGGFSPDQNSNLAKAINSSLNESTSSNSSSLYSGSRKALGLMVLAVTSFIVRNRS